jgi:hypothetical protein
MPRHAFKSLFVLLALAVAMLADAGGAQAVVVQMGGTQLGASGLTGVAPVPGTMLPSTIQRATANASCADPWLTGDLGGPNLPSSALCYQGGPVIHANETFALTWDPVRRDWQTTRNFMEQYLRDVADGSGTFSSPFAVTAQYHDAGGRAANASLYGGGCIDYGNHGGASCQFTNAVGSAQGNNYPASSCTPSGKSYPQVVNDTCITDKDIQDQLGRTVASMGLASHIQPGYTPLLVMMTPPGVEVCLDSGGKLCSANGDPKTDPAQFCSYHSEIQVGQQKYAYVVQPWDVYAGCDDPSVPTLANPPTAHDLAVDAGKRLVSPLSQGEIAAITDPGLNGWYGHDANEINDGGAANPCLPHKGDIVTIGKSSQNPYYTQSEANNAGALEYDPNSPACALGVALDPAFVVPSPIDQGDVVAFDGSESVSSLMIPQSGYSWNFGDGQTHPGGASVVHAYAKGGTYTVTLTVTDRGGDVSSLSQTIQVLGPDGQPVTPSSTPTNPGLHARLALMPQSLRAMLRSGVAANVSANETAAGIATLLVSRGDAARAHIRHGRSATVVVARGTVSEIRTGTVRLSLHLASSIASKLRRLSHVTLTVRISLVDASRNRLTIDAAGRY